MNYIYEKKIFSDDFCDNLISKRNLVKGNEDIIYWKNESVDYLDIFKNLENTVKPHINNYFDTFKSLVSYSDIYLMGYNFIKQEENQQDNLHYDTYLINHKNISNIRPFVCIVYLNSNFEGGECIFPVQKQIIKPEKGKLAIFPASYLFPHMVLGVSGNERYSIRLTYAFCATTFEMDLNKWDKKYDIKSYK
jgi:hypothetical protein